MSNKCNVCRRPSIPFATEKILKKYNIQYFQCGHCGFIQPEFPYWLEEAYSDAITSSDIGLVGRNIELSKPVKSVIFGIFDSSAKFVDYGGGYGMFVRIMRDVGLDYYRFDKFCANLFAKGFDVDQEQETLYELVTAFEVFEHLVQPLDEIEQMLRFSRNILFSTTLIPSNNPKPNEWWYYGLDHGQHVALYTQKSLSVIAKEFNLQLHSDGNSLHLLTEKRISPVLFKLLTRRKVAFLANKIFRKPSLLPHDYFQITGRMLK